MTIPLKRRLKTSSPRHSRGVAALATSLSLVVISTLITLAAARVSSNDQRSSANEVRASEASVLSDGGIGRGAIYLRQNVRQIRSVAAGGWLEPNAVKWSACSGSTVTPPCGNGTSNVFDNTWTAYPILPNLKVGSETLQGDFTSHFVARAAVAGAATPANGTFNVISQGQSGDTLGRSLTRQSFVFQPFLAHRPDAPLIASGTIGLNGTISVVANPNGGGPGVPLSAWSGTNITEGGSVQTCHISEYLATDTPTGSTTDSDGNILVRCPDCECPNAADRQITNKNVEGIDVLDVDGGVGANPDSPYFPPDLFEYTFGVAETSYQTIKDQAQLITDCGDLDANSAGLYWIVGDCTMAKTTDVGSFENPIILVMENGKFSYNAKGEFFGVVFAFAHNYPTSPTGTGGSIDVKLNGGPTLYGSFLSNRKIDLGNGNYTARYDKAVLDNLASGLGAASRIVPIAGSWRNY